MGKAKHRAIPLNGWSKAGTDLLEPSDSPRILAGKNIRAVTRDSGLQDPTPASSLDVPLHPEEPNPNFNVFNALTNDAEDDSGSEGSQSGADAETAGQANFPTISSQAAAVPVVFQERPVKATVAITGAYSADNNAEDSTESAWLGLMASSEVIPMTTACYTGYKALSEQFNSTWQAEGTTVSIIGAYRAPSGNYSAPQTPPLWLHILDTTAATTADHPTTTSVPISPGKPGLETHYPGKPAGHVLLPGVLLTSLPQLGGPLPVVPALAQLPTDGATMASSRAGLQNGLHIATESISHGQIVPSTQAATMAANGNFALSTAAQQLLQTTDATEADGSTGHMLMPEALPRITLPTAGIQSATIPAKTKHVQQRAGSRLVGALSTGLDLGAGLAYYTAGATCGTAQGLTSVGVNLAGYTVGAAFNTAQAAAATGGHVASTTVGAACNTLKAVGYGGGHVAYYSTGAACGVIQALTPSGVDVLGQTVGLLGKKEGGAGTARAATNSAPAAAPSSTQPKKASRLGKLLGGGVNKGANVAYWGTGMACGVLMGLAQGVRKPLS